MFSSRIPPDLVPNRLAGALERLRASGSAFNDLTVSNPTLVGLEYPPGLLSGLSAPEALVYEPAPLGLHAAREAVAGDFARRGLAVPPGRIAITASTSEAYSILFKLLCDPGDEVIVPLPSYPLFDHLARFDCVVTRPYRLEYHGAWSLDRESLQAAVTSRTRAVVAVNPNNPTGSFLSRADLEAMTRVCASSGAALIGDEVFADYPLIDDEGRASSVLDQQDVLTFCLGGLSKSVGLPQVKLGWIAVGGPGGAVEAALARLELICDTYLSAATPAQMSAASLLHRGSEVRHQIARRVRGNYRALSALAAAHPSCRLLHAEGGWTAILQVPAIRSEELLVLALLEEERVLVHPGYFFDFPREAFVVLSLLPPERTLVDGAARVLNRAETPSRSQAGEVTE
jgi:alanine-synthesizing transaminase